MLHNVARTGVSSTVLLYHEWYFCVAYFVLAFQIVGHKTSDNVTYDQLQSTFNFANKPIKDCFIGWNISNANDNVKKLPEMPFRLIQICSRQIFAYTQVKRI